MREPQWHDTKLYTCFCAINLNALELLRLSEIMDYADCLSAIIHRIGNPLPLLREGKRVRATDARLPTRPGLSILSLLKRVVFREREP